MSIHIHEMLDYLDVHPLRDCDSGASVMGVLCDVYTMHSTVDREELRNLLGKLAPLRESLSREASDVLFSAVGDLCMEHERLAFSHGVVVGMLLMEELTALP